MDETANQIEAQIDRTRERLGSNFRELEDKVDAVTDWREHFQSGRACFSARRCRRRGHAGPQTR